MGVPAKVSVEIRDFPGLVTRIDPDDLTPGAGREQLNVQSHHPSQLRVRPGYRPLSFEEDS